MAGKIIIISAPSGCGKSTIIGAIMADLQHQRDLRFSVSATNRPPRRGEVNGVDYHFLTDDEFNARIHDGAFVEYEQVYPGRFYGTLKSEVNRLLGDGHNVILDIDVKGGVNVKRQFGNRAVSIFIEPPSIDTLRQRLETRATDTPEEIAKRVDKARYEMTFAEGYDHRVVNDNLSRAIGDVAAIIDNFLSV